MRWDEDRRDVILMDNYHRSPEFMKLGGRLEMAGMSDHTGRYMLNDRLHGNAYSAFRLALSDNFFFKTTTKPITPTVLQGVDILLIVNPDSPQVLKSAKVISDEEINTIVSFVRNGGSLAAIANTQEMVELEQFNKLMRHFGVEFENNWSPFYENPVPAGNQYLFNVTNLHYGGGCSIRLLPNVPEAAVKVVLRADASGLKRPRGLPGAYKDPDKIKIPALQGGEPIITLSSFGMGKVLAIGDSGSFALDDIALAAADNLAIIKQLFRRLRKGRSSTDNYAPSRWPASRYHVEVDRLIGGPNKDILDLFPPRVEVDREDYRYEFRFNFSRFELEQKIKDVDSSGVATIALNLQSSQNGENGAGHFSFKMTPQGKIFDREIEDAATTFFASGLIDDFAVTFSDPLWRVGQTWENEIPIRIVPLELGGPSNSVITVKARHVVDGLVEKRGRKCAKIVTYAMLDMRQLGIQDLVSPLLLQKPGISRFHIDEGMYILDKEQFFSLEDGRLIYSESYLHYRVWLNGLGFQGDSSLIQLFERVTLALQD